LSSRLKDSTDEAVLMLTGNVFHAENILFDAKIAYVAVIQAEL